MIALQCEENGKGAFREESHAPARSHYGTYVIKFSTTSHNVVFQRESRFRESKRLAPFNVAVIGTISAGERSGCQTDA